jgi:tetratricopeptide (TPR) repeat protein
LADSRFLGGDVDKAVKGYQDVIERYPDNNSIAGVYYKLGNCLKERGANERAKGCFDRIRSLAPLSFEARMITAFSARTVPRRENAAYFSVQVGCFKNKRNAGNMISKLSRKGYDAFLELPSTPHDRLHRVKVGHLVSKEGAEMLASRLRQDGYKTKICPKSSRADE